MKDVAKFAIALWASAVAMPAQAAIIIQVDALATGATTTITQIANPFSVTTVVDSATMFFSFQIDLPDFVNGVSSFNFGSSRSAGIKSGTVLDLGFGNLTGINFHFFENARDGRGCQGDCTAVSTTLDAATFSVLQLIPVPVPEPATWAMMIVGFGIAGLAMRGRRAVSGQFV